MKGGKVEEVVWILNGRNEYPPCTSGDVDPLVIEVSGSSLPCGENALSHPTAENSLSGTVIVSKYAPGEAGVTR